MLHSQIPNSHIGLSAIYKLLNTLSLQAVFEGEFLKFVINGIKEEPGNGHRWGDQWVRLRCLDIMYGIIHNVKLLNDDK
jgi:hypothetical protein